LAGIVLNNADGLDDEAKRTNRAVLGEFCGCPILTEVGRGAGCTDLVMKSQSQWISG
jgi:hypothetical protein